MSTIIDNSSHLHFAPKIRQFAIWNFLSSILSYLVITLRTYYSDIVKLFTPFFYRYAWDFVGSSSYRIPFPLVKSTKIYSALSTFCSHSLSIILPVHSFINIHSVKPKVHVTFSSYLYNWRIECGDKYRLYKGEEKTGILISTCRYIYLRNLKHYELKHSIFHIAFFPEDSEPIDFVETTTLEEAKKIAEWYYREEINVNYNR